MMNDHFLKVLLLSILITALSAHTADANNLRIWNVSMEDRGSSIASSGDISVIVEFDITWDNSWRNTVNHDGVWVFFKIENTESTAFDDLNLDYSSTDSVSTDRQIDPLRSSPGSNLNLEIEVPIDPGRDPEGLFIYRNSTGSGTVQSENVRVPVVVSSTLATTSIRIHAFGIEMVNIPEGPFYAGDNTSTFSFRDGTGNNNPWYIDSTASIHTGTGASGTFYYVNTTASDEFATGTLFTIPGQYPTGYDEFWMMKYELTEGQWVDFYNTLTAAQQANRDITDSSGKNSTSVVTRNTIDDDAGSPATASTSRPNRAMSWISWMDLCAYLDWAKLRPMTELEYEKAARGPLAAVGGEYAWGTTSATQAVEFTSSPELGTEVFPEGDGVNVHYNNLTLSRGDDFLGAQHVVGPVRVGIFAATADGNREAAGAGYYGVMELSGNQDERVIGVGNTTVQYFWPSSGDGQVTTTGNASELGWIGLHTANGFTTGVDSAPDGTGTHGGNWVNTTGIFMRISNRGGRMTGDANRRHRLGGRGVRGYDTPDPLINCKGDDTIQHPEQCDDSGTNCKSCKCDNDTGCLPIA